MITSPTTLSVIVPVYNEQVFVKSSLLGLRVLETSPYLESIKIIVVDDCSQDQTDIVLNQFQNSLKNECWDEKFSWKFVKHEKNQGKGAAIRTGLKFADTTLTVIHDADLEYHPKDLLKMISLFVEEDADAVYGSRYLRVGFKKTLSFWHSLGNRLLTLLCNLVSDLDTTDMETCYKMVRTDLMKSIPLESTDFRIEPELTIKLAKRRANLFEVPISYSSRSYQEGKKINWKDGIKALVAILKFGFSNNICLQDKK